MLNDSFWRLITNKLLHLRASFSFSISSIYFNTSLKNSCLKKKKEKRMDSLK